jgi:hypothetical protein
MDVSVMESTRGFPLIRPEGRRDARLKPPPAWCKSMLCNAQKQGQGEAESTFAIQALPLYSNREQRKGDQ